jgi:hypothetical protein
MIGRKKTIRLLWFIMAVISLSLLSGCVSLVEEITIRDDGSGTLVFKLGVASEDYAAFHEAVPEGFELENLFATIARDEGVTDFTIDQTTQDGYIWDTVELEVENFTATFGQPRRIGPITLEFDEGDESFVFTQVINVADSPLRIPGVNLMDLSVASYEVHLTTPQIVTTNGVQPAASLSTWSIPLDELLQGGSTAFLRAESVLEPYEGVFIPWELFFPYVVIGFLGLGGLAIAVVVIANTVIKREKAPKLKFK